MICYNGKQFQTQEEFEKYCEWLGPLEDDWRDEYGPSTRGFATEHEFLYGES